MILTWFRLWPLLIFPFCVIFLLGLVPGFELFGKPLGGHQLREASVLLLEQAFPESQRVLLHRHYFEGSYLSQVLIHGLIALNLNVVLLPILVALGSLMITGSGWMATTGLAIKTKTARR